MEEKLNKSMDRTDYQFEKFQSKIKQDLKVEYQQEETSSAQQNETVTPSETKITSSKKRRIRKLCLLKSLGIKISKFRKLQEKAIRLGRVRNFSDCRIIKCKRNTLTKHKTMKPQSELTKNNGNFRHPVFRTNSSKAETKMFQAIHHKVKNQKGSLFGKTQNTCVELTRRLGEHLGT
jgi:hypothetical protein